MVVAPYIHKHSYLAPDQPTAPIAVLNKVKTVLFVWTHYILRVRYFWWKHCFDICSWAQSVKKVFRHSPIVLQLVLCKLKPLELLCVFFNILVEEKPDCQIWVCGSVRDNVSIFTVTVSEHKKVILLVNHRVEVGCIIALTNDEFNCSLFASPSMLFDMQSGLLLREKCWPFLWSPTCVGIVSCIIFPSFALTRCLDITHSCSGEGNSRAECWL